ncbi:hypothetical protein [Mangrovibacterium marinum]|uniref:hypothetical protein n=1 Tax=Mangrovibacterium marinum TaxID=1639118 RepID=UPI0011B23D60|nr:hypothetical protein [Mangrovibacterium marinum]
MENQTTGSSFFYDSRIGWLSRTAALYSKKLAHPSYQLIRPTAENLTETEPPKHAAIRPLQVARQAQRLSATHPDVLPALPQMIIPHPEKNPKANTNHNPITNSLIINKQSRHRSRNTITFFKVGKAWQLTLLIIFARL